MTTHARTASVSAAVCALFAVGLSGCGGGDGAVRGADEENDFVRAVEEMTGGESVEPVDFRALKELLPETVAGWQRIEHEGQRSAAAGFTVSNASALYQPESGGYTTINIEITDTGGLGGVAGMGMAAWLSMDVDRETDDGYERTTEYDGHPAYESFQARDGEIGSAQLNIVVEKRFIVQLSGADVSMEAVKNAAAQLDLDRLADLADE